MKRAKIKVVEDVAEAPKWRVTFDLVVAAAGQLAAGLDAGEKCRMVEVLEKAGVDAAEWYAALAKAKREVADEVAALYETMGRKQRGSNGTAAPAVAAPEPCAEEEPSTAGQVVFECHTWFESLPKPQHACAFRALAVLLGFPLGEAKGAK